MKFLSFLCLVLLWQTSFAQSITEDTLKARYFHQLGDSIFSSGLNIDSSNYFFEKAGDIYFKYRLWEHYYSCQNSIAFNLLNEGKYDESQELSSQIVTELGEIQDTLHAELAKAYQTLGNVSTMKTNYKEAINFFEKALEKREKAYGKDHFKVANTLEGMGRVYDLQGNYDKALEFYQKVLNIRGVSRDVVLAESYYKIGDVYYKQAKYEKALEFFQKRLDLLIEVLGENHPDLGHSYYTIGVIYSVLGNYETALEFHQKGLTILIEAFGENHPDLSGYYHNIGFAYSGLGNYEKALEFYQKGLAISIKALGKDHPQIGGYYDNIGIAYGNLGNYEKALEFHQKGLAILIIALGENHPDLSYSYNNIGAIYYEQGNYEESLELFLKSLDISIKALGEDHPELGEYYNNIGAVYFKQGNYEKALKFFLKDLDVSIETFGEDHPDVGLTYNNIGVILLMTGEIDESSDYLGKAGQIFESKLGLNHPFYLEYLDSRCHFYQITNNQELAITSFKMLNSSYIEYIDRMFNLLGENERESFYNTLSDYFDTFKNFTIKNPSLTGDLFNLQLITKSILLNTSAQIKRRIINSGDRVLVGLYDNVEALKQQMGQYSQLGKEELEEQGLDVDSVRNLLDSKDKQLSEFASFYSFDKKINTWQDVQIKLRNEEAAIEIIRMRNYIFPKMKFGDSVYYAALIVTPKTKHQPDLVVLKNGTELEGKYLKGYRNTIKTKTTDNYSYHKFWKPLKDHLKGIRTVYFSPDGVWS